MRRLPRPAETARDVYELCVNGVRSLAARQRFLENRSAIDDAEQAYLMAAERVALHEFRDVPLAVTRQEMIDLYDRRMARRNSRGRPVYDRLMSLAPHGRCPLCGHRLVSTIDHHLPKTEFPVLAITPLNLVPACSECNHSKGERSPSAEGEQTLHPYFDDFDDGQWLFAEVIEVLPVVVRFFARPPLSWGEVRAQRVLHHFETLRLAELYGSHAAEELANIRGSLTILLLEGGAEEVAGHLVREAASRQVVHLNSWQTALYQAISGSRWFCRGGFSAEAVVR